MTVSAPANYTVFPQLVPLCQVREVRGDLVSFCVAVAREGEQLCVWHRVMKREHSKTGRGDLWAGLEVRL